MDGAGPMDGARPTNGTGPTNGATTPPPDDSTMATPDDPHAAPDAADAPPASSPESFEEFRRSQGPAPTIVALLVGVAFGVGVLLWVLSTW